MSAARGGVIRADLLGAVRSMSPAVRGVLEALGEATIVGVARAIETSDLREALLAATEALASARARVKFGDLREGS
jgi:hypothetical protein